VVEAVVAIGLLNLINTDSRGTPTSTEDLAMLREEIDAVDDELARLLTRRMGLVDRVAQNKSKTGGATDDPVREATIIRRLTTATSPQDTAELTQLYRKIFDLSRKRQNQ
jgi:chorismate mutase